MLLVNLSYLVLEFFLGFALGASAVTCDSSPLLLRLQTRREETFREHAFLEMLILVFINDPIELSLVLDLVLILVGLFRHDRINILLTALRYVFDVSLDDREMWHLIQCDDLRVGNHTHFVFL